MSIKAAPVGPVKRLLVDSDPSGDTWVMINPVTYREDMLRGEVLKTREISREGSRMQSVNLYTLYAEEIWLTYDDARIIIDDDGEELVLFKPRTDMTKETFMAALTHKKMPPGVVLEWHTQVVEVNPDWMYPF